MATKEVKQNLEQCSAVAVEGEPIAVAIVKQRQRKLSARNLQKSDLQFPNLAHARPMLLFTLVFSYKRRHTSHKTVEKGNQHWKNREENEKITRIQGNRFCISDKFSRVIWIQSSSFSNCSFLYSLIEPMYFMTNILLFVFLLQSMN